MIKRYALVKNGIVHNIVLIEENNDKSRYLDKFDYVVEIDSEPGSGGIKWSYSPEEGFKDRRKTPVIEQLIIEEPKEE